MANPDPIDVIHQKMNLATKVIAVPQRPFVSR